MNRNQILVILTATWAVFLLGRMLSMLTVIEKRYDGRRRELIAVMRVVAAMVTGAVVWASICDAFLPR